MRFLLDENLSPVLARLLADAGHDSLHVRDIGLNRTPDQVILDRARTDRRILISADTGFGQLFYASSAHLPSLVLLRRQVDRRAASQAGPILVNLGELAADLDAGAIVVVETSRSGYADSPRARVRSGLLSLSPRGRQPPSARRCEHDRGRSSQVTTHARPRPPLSRPVTRPRSVTRRTAAGPLTLPRRRRGPVPIAQGVQPDL
ncbi:MAG: DUF5615 family PIN-like protein [Acidimicrobiales bacterium]